jgi:hypothetical protein
VPPDTCVASVVDILLCLLPLPPLCLTNRDTTELQLISTAADSPGTILERLASHPLVDISEVLSSPANRRPQAVSLDYHRPVWSWANREDQQEWEGLEGWRPGEVASPISRSNDKQVGCLKHTGWGGGVRVGRWQAPSAVAMTSGWVTYPLRGAY